MSKKILVLACILFFPALSGCLGDSGDSAQESPSASPTGSDASASPTPTATGNASAPVANFTFTGPNLTQENGTYTGSTGQYNFTAQEDADENATYDWEFGDGGTGQGGSANHTFGNEGEYAITLTVTNTAGLTAQHNETLNVTAGSGGGGGGGGGGGSGDEPFVVQDTAQDQTISYLDFVQFSIEPAESALKFRIQLRGVLPGTTTHSVYLPSLFVDEKRYEPYYCLGTAGVFSFEDEAVLADADVEFDTAAREWVVTLPFDVIGSGSSYDVRVEGRLGDPCSGGLEELLQDSVPDEGAVTYEA